jgi:hypothetical protein
MSKNFCIPEEMLQKLNEFSGGGYILFIYDENSCPHTYAQFDTAAHGLGIQKFIQNWLNVVDNVNLESAMQDISKPDGEEPAGEEPTDEL